MQQALKAKTDKTLNQLVRYEEGIMTRRTWIELMKSQGKTVVETTKPRVEYNRVKYNRMNGREQEEYERKLAERVPSYRLMRTDSIFNEITKTEYDYFNSLT